MLAADKQNCQNINMSDNKNAIPLENLAIALTI
jgi:hypothetical protein